VHRCEAVPRAHQLESRPIADRQIRIAKKRGSHDIDSDTHASHYASRDVNSVLQRTEQSSQQRRQPTRNGEIIGAIAKKHRNKKSRQKKLRRCAGALLHICFTIAHAVSSRLHPLAPAWRRGAGQVRRAQPDSCRALMTN
jgi:hypothetical protein